MSDLNKLKDIDYSDIPIGYKVIVMGLIERTESAERERDELRGKYQEVSGWYAKMKTRMLSAEAEIARRDAAAGEPVAWQYRYNDGKVGDWKTVDSESECNHSPCYERRAIYTSAPPAVFPECFIRLHNVIGERHHGRMPEEVQKAFDDCSDKISLGAQPQKPVVLPSVRTLLYEDGCPDVFDAKELKTVLDAANVKWEVKK